MKIISKGKFVFFQTIKEGEVFCSNSVYYMKTEATKSIKTEGKRNAVNLKNGEMLYFMDDMSVDKVNGHIEIY